MHSPENNKAEKLFKAHAQQLREQGWTLLLLPGKHSADLEIPDLQKRVALMLEIMNKPRQKSIHMTGFVLYDIESNKVRRLISKYLERMGCLRIQKSVFFCNITRRQWQEIKDNLAKVNDLYENKDSIFFLPVSKDAIEGATCVGQQFISELKDEKPSVVFI